MTKLVACALVVLALAAPARADTAGEERAKVLYAAGKDHYEHGRYEAAATEFEAAYAITPLPELRYNLYLAYERMGRFEAALDHLEAYLASGQISPEERTRLEARRDALRQRAAAANAPRAVPNTGFVARLALGLGYGNADTELYRLYGGTGDLTLFLGWRLIEQLSVHLSVWGISMVNPTAKRKGELTDVPPGDTRYTAAALGAGVTWYLPAQFYLSGSIGGATLSAERGKTKATSDPGLGLLLWGGKEWSLGGEWRFGVAASLSFLSIPEEVQTVVLTSTVTRKVQSSVVLLSVLATIAFD